MFVKRDIANMADELMVTAKALWRATYCALFALLTLGLLLISYQYYCCQLRANDLSVAPTNFFSLNLAMLALAALIIVLMNILTIRTATRRQYLTLAQMSSTGNQSSVALGLMIESHILLDDAIQFQLKGVINESENAAMMLIIKARTISTEANVLMAHFEQYDGMNESPLTPLQQNNLCDAVKAYRAQLRAEITEILGQIQFQDVVRQRVERAEIAVAERNDLFIELVAQCPLSNAALLALSVKMRTILEEYLLNEHTHAAAFSQKTKHDDSMVKVELF